REPGAQDRAQSARSIGGQGGDRGLRGGMAGGHENRPQDVSELVLGIRNAVGRDVLVAQSVDTAGNFVRMVHCALASLMVTTLWMTTLALVMGSRWSFGYGHRPASTTL